MTQQVVDPLARGLCRQEGDRGDPGPAAGHLSGAPAACPLLAHSLRAGPLRARRRGGRGRGARRRGCGRPAACLPARHRRDDRPRARPVRRAGTRGGRGRRCRRCTRPPVDPWRPRRRRHPDPGCPSGDATADDRLRRPRSLLGRRPDRARLGAGLHGPRRGDRRSSAGRSGRTAGWGEGRVSRQETLPGDSGSARPPAGSGRGHGRRRRRPSRGTPPRRRQCEPGRQCADLGGQGEHPAELPAGDRDRPGWPRCPRRGQGERQPEGHRHAAGRGGRQ